MRGEILLACLPWFWLLLGGVACLRLLVALSGAKLTLGA